MIEAPAPIAPGDSSRRVPLCALLAALLPCLAVLLAGPIVEMGFNDDWAYAFSAKVLSETGRLVYTGWTEPLLGVQAWWGALLIRLFGFSFTLLRLGNLPFVAGCGLLTFALARRAKLTDREALLAALTVALSPLAVPLSASFMTEVPATCLALLSIWCFDRALATGGRRAALAWLLIGVATGLAAGSVRQIMWAAPLAIVPFLAIARRRERPFVYAAIVLWLGFIASGLAMMAWQQRQPFVQLGIGLLGIRSAIEKGPAALAKLTLMAIAILLPCGASLLVRWRARPAAKLAALAAGAALASAAWRLDPQALLFPWVGNTITIWGVLAPGTTLLGTGPVLLTPLLQWLITACVVTTAIAIISSAATHIRGASPWRFLRAGTSAPLRLGLLFAIIYVAAVQARDPGMPPFDRYLLPLLGFGAIALLRLARAGARANACQAPRHRPPAIAWALLLVLAAYAVATTHDALGRRRAQLVAAEMLQRHGAPRTAISAGLEFDAWTQLTRQRYINRPGVVRIDPGSPFRVLPRRYYGANLNVYWVSYMPALRPRYFVFLSPLPQAARTSFPPVIYRCWLPPFRRALVIQCATPITPEDAPITHRPAPVVPGQESPKPLPASAGSLPAEE